MVAIEPKSLARRVIYFLYERHLLRQIHQRPMPHHVAIIVDGNRRYAQEQGLTDPFSVYDLGAQKLDDVVEWCAQLAIPAITLWVFSTENLHRSASAVSAILTAVESKLAHIADNPRIQRLGVRVRAVGKLELLPDSVLAAIKAAENATVSNRTMVLTIAVAYGGRQEIADAVRRLLREKTEQGASLEEIIEGITQEQIARYLYAPDLPDPDLIIRTSGEIRLSGFLLWQSAYSEFYFCEVYWPAFRKIDFLRAIRSYQQRQRRFGK